MRILIWVDRGNPSTSVSEPVSLSPIITLFTTGRAGFAWEKLPDGSNSNTPIVGLKIKFTKNDGTFTRTVFTDESGHYRVGLPAGKYIVVATHPDYEIFDPFPGVFVVTGVDGFQTGNFFIKKLTCGLGGFTYVRNENGSIGPKLDNVTVVFTKTDGLFTKTITSNDFGYYKISLPEGNYYLNASRTGYQTYTSSPGFSVVTPQTYSTRNFFLKSN